MPKTERRRLTTLATAAKRADKGSAVSTNRLLAILRRVCSWAVAEGDIPTSPFKRSGETSAAGPHLRACIECAISTGMRIGESPSLRWRDVRYDVSGKPMDLVLPAATTKTNRTRVLPISARLSAVLEMRRTAPDGTPLGADAHVFGNEVGERIGTLKTAWTATCRRAGITGLHFHDLRRSFACALLESGAALHDVRDFLGHTDITTTSKDLAATPVRLRATLDRLEGAADAADTPEPTPAPQPAPPLPPVVGNLLYFGDNLDILRRLVKEESGDDLVDLDPPFNSKQD